MFYSNKKIIAIVTAIIIITIIGLVVLTIISVKAETLYRDVTMQYGGRTRTYNYFIPANLPASPVPLLFNLHGGGSNADALCDLANNLPAQIFFDLAEQEKFIMVLPDGTPDPNNPDPTKLYWHDCRTDLQMSDKTVNDTGYIDALITWFSSNYNIDSNRIYAYGASNGGGMCFRLALELSHKIAAVAPIIQALACNNTCGGSVNTIPVVMIAGTDDPINEWDGGLGKWPERGCTMSINDTVAFWVNHNGADTVPEITEIPDGPYDDHGTNVTLYAYDNGLEGTEVLLYKINGGGHAEPSIKEQHSTWWESIVGYQNHDIETAEEVWKFFKKHGLNGPVSSPEAVGGITISVNKFSLVAPYIGLTVLLAVAVATIVYVKKRKRNTEINS